MRRKIYLENQTGERVALNGENGLWLVDAEGFGAENENSYADYGYGFFVNTNAKNHPQQTVTGTLIFQGTDTLAVWQEFAAFALTATKLYIVYVPVRADREYRRQAEIKFLTKGERKVNYLEVAASFICLTPWYRLTPVNASMQKQSENAARYSWRYGTTVYGRSGGDGISAEVTAAGHLPSAVVFEFDGEIVNPVLKLTDENGETIGECALAASTETGEQLVISTLYTDSYARKISNGTETDLLSTLDISKEDPFFRIPVGKTCDITVSSDSTSGTAKVSVYDYYRSV